MCISSFLTLPRARDLTLIFFGATGLTLLSARLLYYRSAFASSAPCR
jgi:hypothetical protein